MFFFLCSSLRIKTKTKEDEQVKEKFKLFRCLLDGRSKVFSCFSFRKKKKMKENCEEKFIFGRFDYFLYYLYLFFGYNAIFLT